MFDSNITNFNNVNSKSAFAIECKDIVLKEFQLEDLDAIYNITLQPEIEEFIYSSYNYRATMMRR